MAKPLKNNWRNCQWQQLTQTKSIEKGKVWCFKCKRNDHPTNECAQCDYYGAFGHP